MHEYSATCRARHADPLGIELHVHTTTILIGVYISLQQADMQNLPEHQLKGSSVKHTTVVAVHIPLTFTTTSVFSLGSHSQLEARTETLRFCLASTKEQVRVGKEAWVSCFNPFVATQVLKRACASSCMEQKHSQTSLHNEEHLWKVLVSSGLA